MSWHIKIQVVELFQGSCEERLDENHRALVFDAPTEESIIARFSALYDLCDIADVTSAANWSE